MTFWCGSGPVDPCLCLMDPDVDPEPAIFVIDLQEGNKKLIFSAQYKNLDFYCFETSF